LKRFDLPFYSFYYYFYYHYITPAGAEPEKCVNVWEESVLGISVLACSHFLFCSPL